MKNKCRKTVLTAAMLMFALSLIFSPQKAEALSPSGLMLFPPLCYVNEMYDKGDNENTITSNDISNKEKTEVKIKFKLFEVVSNLINRLFG